jgi:hypothetical protein
MSAVALNAATVALFVAAFVAESIFAAFIAWVVAPAAITGAPVPLYPQ